MGVSLGGGAAHLAPHPWQTSRLLPHGGGGHGPWGGGGCPPPVGPAAALPAFLKAPSPATPAVPHRGGGQPPAPRSGSTTGGTATGTSPRGRPGLRPRWVLALLGDTGGRPQGRTVTEACGHCSMHPRCSWGGLCCTAPPGAFRAGVPSTQCLGGCRRWVLSHPWPPSPQDECSRYGPMGRLASIHSQGASRVLSSYVARQSDGANTWIGLRDDEHVSHRGGLHLCLGAALATRPGHPLTPVSSPPGTHRPGSGSGRITLPSTTSAGTGASPTTFGTRRTAWCWTSSRVSLVPGSSGGAGVATPGGAETPGHCRTIGVPGVKGGGGGEGWWR